MQIDARRLLFRVEMRIAQMTGRELTTRDPSATNNAWSIGLIRTWKQVRRLHETGELIDFVVVDGRATDETYVRRLPTPQHTTHRTDHSRADHWRDL
jgi:cytosine/adenosine deaminase-related metal-dependent hydrolase